LEDFSEKLSESEKTHLAKRSALYYLTLLPGVSLFSIIFNPRSWKVIMRSCYDALVSFSPKGSPHVLAHRDITPSNIMLSGDNIYILDSENMVLTVPGYDYAYLSATPNQQKLVELLPSSFITPNTFFLKNYIILHHILGSGEFFHVNFEYVKLLKEIYA
jgi:serine/threonine protein kinase